MWAEEGVCAGDNKLFTHTRVCVVCVCREEGVDDAKACIDISERRWKLLGERNKRSKRNECEIEIND